MEWKGFILFGKKLRRWHVDVLKAYSKAIKAKDPETENEKENAYYGRGYVQLTWDYNYKNIGKALGYGDRLYIKPEIAYAVMSYGMRNGTFTEYGLKECIIGVYADYKAARKIINGTEKAELINAELAYLDLEMAKAYRQRYQRLTDVDKAKIKSEQHQWSVRQEHCAKQAPDRSPIWRGC